MIGAVVLKKKRNSNGDLSDLLRKMAGDGETFQEIVEDNEEVADVEESEDSYKVTAKEDKVDLEGEMKDSMEEDEEEVIEEDKEPMDEEEDTESLESAMDKKVGKTRVVDGYIKKEKKEGEDEQMDTIGGDCAPCLDLESEQVPEVLDYQIGDMVTLTMKVTGLNYRTEEDKAKCRVTLSLQPKK